MELNEIIYLIITSLILIILAYLLLKKYFKKSINIISKKSNYLERYSKLVNQFEKENKKFKYVDLIFMGDSLIFRYNIKQFFPEFTSLNRGIGGDTTFGLEKRLKVSCFDVKSKIVLMLIGINNIKTMFENYENILIKLKNNINDRKIIICSLIPMSKRNKKNNKFAVENNKKLKILAQKYDFIFLDLYKPLLDIKTNQIIDTFTIDGLHFSFEGYKVITQEIKNVLNKIL